MSAKYGVAGTLLVSNYFGRALRTDLHSAVLLGGEDGNKAGNKEHLKRLYNICMSLILTPPPHSDGLF